MSCAGGHAPGGGVGRRRIRCAEFLHVDDMAAASIRDGAGARSVAGEHRPDAVA